jgi:hypothetical protein
MFITPMPPTSSEIDAIADVSGIVRGLIPALRLLTSFIYAFASLSVVAFLHAFHKAQS